MKNAVIYLRVAHADEGSEQAVAAQREACHRIAERHGLTIIREYSDLGRPAHLEEQTELRNLLATLEAQRDAAYVVVWDYTRLSRNLKTLNELIEHIRNFGAEVVTLTGVEVAERFIQSGGLFEESTARTAPAGLFSLKQIRTAFDQLAEGQDLIVTALLPTGETISGTVVGVGSRLSIRMADNKVSDDIRAEWAVRLSTQTSE